MSNPAMALPGVMTAIQGLVKAKSKGGVPEETLELVHLRASQINGCSACVYAGGISARKAGMSDERLWAVAAWREAPYFSEAERTALELAETMTRLSDRTGEAVPDELWERLSGHYDEPQRAALILWIATANFFNRINTAIKEPAGTTWG
ncbi:carboxymuconolactone decarboxylase family protein [Acrocarpospora macrocephala]|uniref:Alkyl hydroperoxide reductase AhpD n=1 Tax=Acrocarpospora macrocephala TaxID=150177 RepID=A0A5M3WY16_9ACTN|nr:carboxymuconolactone decarboxylase family protein [Acrocarpospora macrocephala]GES13296.1 alkyl hydroperoxide reductase AhpD [Acrocarpospora macrocephala]